MADLGDLGKFVPELCGLGSTAVVEPPSPEPEEVAPGQHHEIRLFFGRTLVVSEIEYEYRWEANAQDFGEDGSRHLIIEVQGRTADGRLGDIARIEVQNVAPDMHAIEPIIRSFPESVFIDWSNFVPQDFDFDHYDVLIAFSDPGAEETVSVAQQWLAGHWLEQHWYPQHWLVGTSVPTITSLLEGDVMPGRIYRRGRTQNNVIIPTKVPIFFQIVPYDAFGVGIPTRVFEGSPA